MSTRMTYHVSGSTSTISLNVCVVTSLRYSEKRNEESKAWRDTRRVGLRNVCRMMQ